MTENKINKSLDTFADLHRDLPRRQKTAVFLSDSKGNYLKREITTRLERDIEWLCEGGITSINGIDWFKTEYQKRLKDIGPLEVYVWFGSCDLTSKKNGFISLNSSHINDSARLVRAYEKFSEFAQSEGFSVVFLEVPILSIKEYNKFWGHENPEIFEDQDRTLQSCLKIVNEEIQRLNFVNDKHSPNFSVDIWRCRKNRGKQPKYFYNYVLFKDGVHPRPLLAKLWLKRIAALIRQDCY